MKIPPHLKRGVTVIGNSCMGIEKSAGISVLRDCFLKTPLHLKHRVMEIEKSAGCSVLRGGVLKTGPHLRQGLEIFEEFLKVIRKT